MVYIHYQQHHISPKSSHFDCCGSKDYMKDRKQPFARGVASDNAYAMYRGVTKCTHTLGL